MRNKISATAFNAYDSRRRITHRLHKLADKINAPRFTSGDIQFPNSFKRRKGIDI
jgi:hypothetical protein